MQKELVESGRFRCVDFTNSVTSVASELLEHQAEPLALRSAIVVAVLTDVSLSRSEAEVARSRSSSAINIIRRFSSWFRRRAYRYAQRTLSDLPLRGDASRLSGLLELWCRRDDDLDVRVGFCERHGEYSQRFMPEAVRILVGRSVASSIVCAGSCTGPRQPQTSPCQDALSSIIWPVSNPSIGGTD
jgi:hypothetical protein